MFIEAISAVWNGVGYTLLFIIAANLLFFGWEYLKG